MVKHFQQFWSILDNRQKKFFVGLVFTNISNALLEIMSLGILFPIIFSLLEPDSLNSIPIIKTLLENYAPIRGDNFIIFALIVTSVGFLIKNIVSGLFLWFQIYFTEKTGADISNRLYLKYINSSYEEHTQRSTAEIIRNINQAVREFKSFFLFTILRFFSEFILGIFYLVFLIYVDPTLMAYFFIIMSIVMFFVIRKMRKLTKNLGKEKADWEKEKNYFVLQSIMGFKEIKVFMKQFFFSNKVKSIQQNLKLADSKFVFYQQIPRLIIETAIVFLAITAITILFVKNQGAPYIIAKLGIFSFAALKIFPMLNFFSSLAATLSVGVTNLKIIYKELALEEEKKTDNLEKETQPLLVTPIPFRKTIELKNIYFNFCNQKQENKSVFNGVNLIIKKNSKIGLVGESGSGKTTLVDIIMGLLSPCKGSILIDGKPLTKKGVWSNKIGYIPQQIFLSNASIKENVAFGQDKDFIDNKKVWKVLEIAQLKKTVKDFPQGIETGIGEYGFKLSGGQRQRIGIARALYQDPEILVLDEATSALDNRTELYFVNQLKKIKIKTTQIIIAHRLSTVKYCDLIYVIDKGNIVEKGSYAQLEKKGHHFRKILLKDFKKLKKKNSLKGS